MSNTTYSPSSTITTHWLASEALGEIDALCLGTGRFLRSVLVPALVGAGLKPALIQTRGRSFLEYMQTRSGASRGTYPVDTVLSSGEIDTQEIPCWGAFSLGKEDDKRALAETLQEMKGISVLGVGVTEAGLVSKDTPVMKDLYDLLHLCFVLQQDGVWKSSKICVIDMDNVPNNGDKIQTYLKQLASSDEVRMQEFLTKQVVFMNTMVDRITSHRKGHPLIPRCEPTPAKALVVLDAGKNLPPSFSQQPGIVVRATPQELQKDISLKLRIANGTHTAVAHSLALLKHLQTDVLSKHPLFMSYLDLLVQDQIIPASKTISTEKEAAAVWEDWRQRLVHPHFGLSSFFITQNGPAKGGIRWSPTVTDLCRSNHKVAVTFAFAYAALLRWLTPIPERGVANGNGVYIGWLDGVEPKSLTNIDTASTDVQAYADGLRYDLKQGWYEYKCENNALVEMLQDCIGKQPSACLPAVRAYLVAPTGGNLKSIAADSNVDVLVNTTATLYSRMLAGDGQESLMQELLQDKRFSSPCSTYMDIATENPQRHWLEYRRRVIPDFSRLLKFPVNLESVESVVIAEVAGAVAIDLHTHLLPPTHGYLCAWGIDELLSYHYLVAEYFMTAPASMSPEDFYAKSKQEQAELVWEALFVDRLPISEATRGVVTTLMALGLANEVKARDLQAIRAFYLKFRNNGPSGSEAFVEQVFTKSGIEYAIMTNIPFDTNEAMHWRPHRKEYSARFRSAIRVDPLLAGDNHTVEAALKASGYDTTLEGARQYLRDWCDTMHPEYMMASTPHDFVLREGTIASVQKRGVDEEAMKEPFAFVKATQGSDCVVTCDGAEDEAPSAVDENSDFVSDVLMKVCEERDLPLALKIGAHRGVNPRLKSAGDGVVAFADAGMLGRLCMRYPKVRFLATFLSRNNQHEACVLASKFRNLHIYGCWWYCNNPSIIQEISTMRIEMLGTAFTVQHSDARVVDQLLYKWPHSRAIIAQVLTLQLSKLIESGWEPTREEIRRDVKRLFGGSYEEFMSKSLL